ncbi:D-alanyl-D-alanine carboxypeptidase family protein [Azospira restricta]|uniref:D-alanyl-D-alanine carboxypeptidase family protein n=1 Tax=Azospira restricta TaxID=404405 RepID=A0A974PVQ6_9RHOO|nr:D-alanyl-D-alanine carboxypeptidase family protein [Azospira restricta]
MNPRLAALCSELGITGEQIAARGLSEHTEASVLEVAEAGAGGRDHLLTPAAANAWRNLKAAALADGVSLFIVSAFRSIDRQFEIVRRKRERGTAIDTILSVCAPPGFSEHHTGRAIDLSTPGCRPLETEFDQTMAFSWLSAHAAEFGYRLSYPVGNPQGYQYEPWHWCFDDIHRPACPPRSGLDGTAEAQ